MHWLGSSPATWLQMANSLQADPWVREHYQFWFAYYPTGAPLAASAMRVRESLRGLRDAIDPPHADPALDRMVVVGHSLGGVLSRQMLLSSGPALERQLFTRPFAEVAMSPESRATLAKLLYFEREPSIGRAIFLAAPHRGSRTADLVIGRVTSRLVRRPQDIEALHAEVLALNGPEVFRGRFRRRPMNSVDNLEWDSPILSTLIRLPVPTRSSPRSRPTPRRRHGPTAW